MDEPMFYDGLTPAWLAALRQRPQSARDLAVTLGQGTSPSNVAAIRATLKQMERKGLVQRSRTRNRPTWIWEVCAAMPDDPMVREIGRLTDDAGRVLIIGVDYDALTLRTLHTRTKGAVALGMTQQEELGQLVIAAAWRAGWQRRQMDADTDAAALAGAP